MAKVKLARTNLRRANLKRSRLSGAIAVGANLSGANLFGIEAEDADFSGQRRALRPARRREARWSLVQAGEHRGRGFLRGAAGRRLVRRARSARTRSSPASFT